MVIYMSTYENKVIMKKRVFIFVVICFAMTWIYDFSVIRCISIVKNDFLKQVLSFLGMYFPLLAHLFTRAITKEGFHITGDGSLMIKFDCRKITWLFAGMLLPFLYCEIGNAILVWTYPKLLLSKSMCKALGITSGILLKKMGINLLLSLLFAFVAIGEESGFRGYMMPKLIKIMGTSKAVILGGIIWGVWHLPLICMGHNFGTTYPGFPYIGILLMIVNCICAGSILTFLTMKTNSVWPAAIMHAVNNSRPGILVSLMNTHELVKLNTIVVAAISQIPLFIIGIICLLIMTKTNLFQHGALFGQNKNRS